MKTLHTFMTTGVAGKEDFELQLDDRNRLYINGQRVATEIDLGNARLPVWIAAVATAVSALASSLKELLRGSRYARNADDIHGAEPPGQTPKHSFSLCCVKVRAGSCMAC